MKINLVKLYLAKNIYVGKESSVSVVISPINDSTYFSETFILITKAENSFWRKNVHNTG